MWGIKYAPLFCLCNKPPIARVTTTHMALGFVIRNTNNAWQEHLVSLMLEG